MSELKAHNLVDIQDYRGEVYLKSEADAVITEKDAEIARLKDRSLDVKNAVHVLKALNFYRYQLTHCAYDERTAQWILDHWEQDYKRVEAYRWTNLKHTIPSTNKF